MSGAEIHDAAKKRQTERGGTYRQAMAYVMADRQVKAWNAAYPVGTPVILTPHTGALSIETRTRSEAWQPAPGQASVMVDGKTGGYGLGWVKPVRRAKVSP